MRIPPRSSRTSGSPLPALRSEIDAYWRVLDGMLDWTPEERNRRREAFFYDELDPAPQRHAPDRRPHRHRQ